MERELTKEEIIRNNVETINQYKVLQYLKKNLNANEFRIFLHDCDTIKVYIFRPFLASAKIVFAPKKRRFSLMK